MKSKGIKFEHGFDVGCIKVFTGERINGTIGTFIGLSCPYFGNAEGSTLRDVEDEIVKEITIPSVTLVHLKALRAHLEGLIANWEGE